MVNQNDEKNNQNSSTHSVYSKIDINNSLLIDIPAHKIKEYTTECSNFPKDKEYFHAMSHTEPHTIRRELILKDHPEIEKLYKNKEPWKTLVPVVLINIIQFYICYIIYKYDIGYLPITIFAALIGAIFNHAMFALFHDITHFNCLKSIFHNQIWAIMCNLPQIIPSAISFGRYHREHHTNLGDPLYDPDIPTLAEIKYINTPFRKLCYVVFMPFFYALRPFFKVPKSMSKMEIVNIVVCVSYAYLLYVLFTGKAIVYLLLCTYIGLSLHPVSAHVIAEHYEFFQSQDTYSYYGVLNWLNFNLGYHVEHHDFPSVPWHKLPEITRIAPEYYENLPKVGSYSAVLLKYIFEENMGPWSRITLDKKERDAEKSATGAMSDKTDKTDKKAN